MMRAELLQWLEPKEIVMLALLCKKMNGLIDPNRKLDATDEPKKM